MRQDQRLARGRDRALHQVEAAVRHVDHDAERIAAPDHFCAEVGQATLLGWLRLDVAQLVRPIVRELELAQLPALIRLVETLDLAVEPVAAFRRHDHRWPARPRRPQIRGCLDDRHRLVAHQLVKLGELGLAEIVELAGTRITDRPDAATRGIDHRRIADDAEADRGHAALLHRRGHLQQAVAPVGGADQVSGMAVEVDGHAVGLRHRGHRQAEERAGREQGASRQSATCWAPRN